MRIEPGKTYAVLTGDIVASSKLLGAERNQLHHFMRTTSSELRSFFEHLVPMDASVFRGDSWQLLVTDPSESLRVALFYRANLRAAMKSKRVDTRTSIGIGPIEFIPPDNVAGGDGQAFRASGKALEEIGKSRRMTLSWPDSPDPEGIKALDTLLSFVDELASNWTEGQARAVCGALLRRTQEQTAKSWPGKGISQQAVAQHLDRAGWSPLEDGLSLFQSVVSRLVSQLPPPLEDKP
jgi:hypothetical protein